MEFKDLEYPILIFSTILVIGLLNFIIRRGIDIMIKRNSAKLQADPTNFIFLKNAIPYLLWGFGLIWIFQKIPYFNTLGTALFAGAGVIAAVIGFASQKAFSNIIGGLFILIFKPFRVGDIIEIANAREGVVEGITLRHTIIKNYENRRIVIPNSVISEETIINSSIEDEKIRKHIEFGVSYSADVDLATQIIQEEIKAHPLWIDNRTPEQLEKGAPEVDVRLVRWADSAIILRAYVWTRSSADAFMLQCDVLKSVKRKFDLQKIGIPFPHMNVIIENEQ